MFLKTLHIRSKQMASILVSNKRNNNCGSWSRDILIFFLWKDLGLVFPSCLPSYFHHLMLYLNNWSNFIAWLFLLFETLGNICFTVYDSLDFEINLSFLIRPFLSMAKKRQNKILNVLWTRKAFTVNEKYFSSIL